MSVHNPNGMWVIGHHGGYYVNIPTQGATGSKVYLTVPVSVASTAQIPAGWALYNSLPSYPNFVGMAGLLSEGIDHLGRLVRRLIERRRPASPPARRRIETAPDDIKRSIA